MSNNIIPFNQWAQFIHSSRDSGFHQQIVFKFPNGYGASVVRIPDIFSGFEVAVLKFSAPDNHEITYDTHITDDVLRGDSDDMNEVLAQINALPAHGIFIGASNLIEG